MDDLDQSIEAAGDRLRALADGPAREAAEAMDRHFSEAGKRIEAALSNAARTGQLDFERMTEAVLKDLARLAAESAFGGAPAAGPTINLSLNSNGETGARGILASQGAVSAALARAVSAGGRFL